MMKTKTITLAGLCTSRACVSRIICALDLSFHGISLPTRQNYLPRLANFVSVLSQTRVEFLSETDNSPVMTDKPRVRVLQATRFRVDGAMWCQVMAMFGLTLHLPYTLADRRVLPIAMEDPW
jgi:hypothetical protein